MCIAVPVPNIVVVSLLWVVTGAFNEKGLCATEGVQGAHIILQVHIASFWLVLSLSLKRNVDCLLHIGICTYVHRNSVYV